MHVEQFILWEQHMIFQKRDISREHTRESSYRLYRLTQKSFGVNSKTIETIVREGVFMYLCMDTLRFESLNAVAPIFCAIVLSVGLCSLQ